MITLCRALINSREKALKRIIKSSIYCNVSFDEVDTKITNLTRSKACGTDNSQYRRVSQMMVSKIIFKLFIFEYIRNLKLGKSNDVRLQLHIT